MSNLRAFCIGVIITCTIINIIVLLTRMKGADDEYERAVEQMEYDMLYEPTYNPEDGSM